MAIYLSSAAFFFNCSISPSNTRTSQSLLLAHENLQDRRFQILLECLSGMGTPHAGENDRDTLLRLNQVLYSCAKISVQKKKSRLPASDVFQLANLAATFEQIATIPVLSVFEYSDPRTSMPKFFNKKTKVRPRFLVFITTSNLFLCRHWSINSWQPFHLKRSICLGSICLTAMCASYLS